MHTIKLTFKLEGGLEGIDSDPYNPLARALSNLFESGRPFKRLTQCFCSDPTENRGNTIPFLRWFGIFIHSVGNRIVFFPGLSHAQDLVQGYYGNSLNWNQSFDFDHFSLEKDLKKWHITSSGSKKHLGSPLTLHLGDERYLWFGLSISKFEVLRVARENTQVIAQVPPSDSARRAAIFHDARSDVVFQLLDFHPDTVPLVGSKFLHFGIVVGPKGFETYTGSQIGIPDGSPFLMPSSISQQGNHLPVRIHKFSLSEEIDLQIVTTMLQGKLTMPVVITSPSDQS